MFCICKFSCSLNSKREYTLFLFSEFHSELQQSTCTTLLRSHCIRVFVLPTVPLFLRPVFILASALSLLWFRFKFKTFSDFSFVHNLTRFKASSKHFLLARSSTCGLKSELGFDGLHWLGLIFDSPDLLAANFPSKPRNFLLTRFEDFEMTGTKICGSISSVNCSTVCRS